MTSFVLRISHSNDILGPRRFLTTQTAAQSHITKILVTKGLKHVPVSLLGLHVVLNKFFTKYPEILLCKADNIYMTYYTLEKTAHHIRVMN